MANTPSKSLKHVLYGLNDREYYGITDIVRLVFPLGSEREAAKSYRNRLYYIVKHKFPMIMHPDGELAVAGSNQTLAAWCGESWKRLWDAYENHDRELMSKPHHGKQCSYPINAQVLILTLDPKTPYSVKDILAEAEKMNFLADLPDFKRRMEWQIRNFRSRYIKCEPDSYKFGGPAKENCWLGVRWLKALPASYVGPELAQTIKQAEWQVAAHPPRSLFEHHIRFWRSMAAGLVLAFLAAWLFWYFKPENRQWRQYQQAIHADGGKSLATLKQLWQQDHSAIEKVALAAHITAKYDQMDSYEDEDVALLRELLKVEGVARQNIVELIAQAQFDQGVAAIAIQNIHEPVFLAAVPENPFVLYEEGLLRPGDWLVFQEQAGYVNRITIGGIYLSFVETTEFLPFVEMTTLDSGFRCNSIFKSWPGRSNLKFIITAIAHVNGWRTDFSPDIEGHIGGCSDAITYEEFIYELEAGLPVTLVGDVIEVQGGRDYEAFIFPNGITIWDTLPGFLERFSNQFGKKVELIEPKAIHNDAAYTLVDVDFHEFCRMFRLNVALKAKE